MIYLDNAASSGYKPKCVINAVETALKKYSANPGRSGHKMSASAAEKIYKVREKISNFFGGSGAENVVFTANCTESINFVLKGVLTNGDHLIISNLEHNAVARPAEKLKNEGVITLDIFNAMCDDIEKELSLLVTPKTKMIFCTHASNVCGKIIDIEKIGSFCKKHGILFGVDAAQSGGVVDINMQKYGIDYLCLAPHKGLFAPMGTGILIAEKPISRTIIEGGTGTASLSLVQPDIMPEKFESGTINLPGIFGIAAGIDYLNFRGRENIYRHEMNAIMRLYNRLKNNKNITVFSGEDLYGNYTPVLSIDIRGINSNQAADYLSKKGVAVRGGLHCASLAHKTLGTEKNGTVRFSSGITTLSSEIDYTANIIENLIKNKYLYNKI